MKIVIRVVVAVLVIAGLYATNLFLKPISRIKASLAQTSTSAPITVDGEVFRDLNRNGALDPYEDYRVATTDRVEDLLKQMTLEEKVGQMFHPPVLIEPDPLFRVFLEAMNAGTSIEELISQKSLTHFNFYGSASPQNIAKRLNKLQRIAERTRLASHCPSAATRFMKYQGAVALHHLPSTVSLSGLLSWALPLVVTLRCLRHSEEQPPKSTGPSDSPRVSTP